MGKYREKVCPRCGNSHRKRRKFCSRSCGNQRNHTEEHKEALSSSLKNFYDNTEEGAAIASRNSFNTTHYNNYRYGYTSEKEVALKESDFKLEIPDIRNPLKENQFLEGGDIWETV
jgi:hypothetical protein